nr:MAG: type I phosphodiesterase / nucleotide pyrophosphatase [Candidatus Nanosalinarum sp. J07AB56]
MDYKLIQKLGVKSLTDMEKFESYNNSTGMTTIITNELWASFITGKTWREHGIISKNRPESELLFKVEKLNRFWWWRKFQGIRHKIYGWIPFLSSGNRKYTRQDLKSRTMFEQVHSSKAIDVRSYNVGYNYDLMTPLEFDLSLAVEELDRLTNWKKQELFDSMGKDHDLVMAHFHKPDHIHHWFWEVGKMDKVEETYHEMDEMAAEIKEKAEKEGFDTVLFVSDHGLPDVENGGHNENAFYSCNKELFGDKTPHITDFHDKILELTGSETSDIDV